MVVQLVFGASLTGGDYLLGVLCSGSESLN